MFGSSKNGGQQPYTNFQPFGIPTQWPDQALEDYIIDWRMKNHAAILCSATRLKHIQQSCAEKHISVVDYNPLVLIIQQGWAEGRWRSSSRLPAVSQQISVSSEAKEVVIVQSFLAQMWLSGPTQASSSSLPYQELMSGSLIYSKPAVNLYLYFVT